MPAGCRGRARRAAAGSGRRPGRHPPGVAQPVGSQLRAERPAVVLHRAVGGLGDPRGRPVALHRLGEVGGLRPGRPRPPLHQVGDRVVVGAGEPALGQPGELEVQRVRGGPPLRQGRSSPRAAGAGAPSRAPPAVARCAGAGRPWSSRAGRPSRAPRRRRPAHRAPGPSAAMSAARVGRSYRAGACRSRRTRADRGRPPGTRRRPGRPAGAARSTRTAGIRAAAARADRCRPRRRAGARRWP